MNDINAEINQMLNAGMAQLSLMEMFNKIDSLGYKIDKSMSFCYFNQGNANHWAAKSCYVVEKDTGLSFANINAREDENYKALQELRRSTFTLHKGRLWEI